MKKLKMKLEFVFGFVLKNHLTQVKYVMSFFDLQFIFQTSNSAGKQLDESPHKYFRAFLFHTRCLQRLYSHFHVAMSPVTQQLEAKYSRSACLQSGFFQGRLVKPCALY